MKTSNRICNLLHTLEDVNMMEWAWALRQSRETLRLILPQIIALEDAEQRLIARYAVELEQKQAVQEEVAPGNVISLKEYRARLPLESVL